MFTVTCPFVTLFTQHLMEQILFSTPRTVRRHDTNGDPSTYLSALQFGSLFAILPAPHTHTHTNTHLRRSGQRSTAQCTAHWQNTGNARTRAPHTSPSALTFIRPLSKPQVCCEQARRGQSLFVRDGNQARWQRQSSFGRSPTPTSTPW